MLGQQIHVFDSLCLYPVTSYLLKVELSVKGHSQRYIVQDAMFLFTVVSSQILQS